MTDEISGQSPSGELPDVEEAFPQSALPDAEEAFPASVEHRRAREALGTSPIQDFLFSNDGPVGTAIHRAKYTLDAFGHGAKDAWGGYPTTLSDEAREYLTKAGMLNDYKNGENSLIKAANEVLFRPSVIAWNTAEGAFKAMSAGFAGAQAVVARTGQEEGFPRLGRELAAMPEAFMGSPHPTGTPHPAAPRPLSMAELAEARDLKVIGAGEAGWSGFEEAKPAEPAPAIVREIEKDEAKAPPSLATPAEIEPTPAAPEPAAAPAQPQDIHAAARQVAPEVFREYDALTTRRDTFRRWIDELRETRDAEAEAKAPHAAEIADLQARIDNPETTPRLRKKYEARIAPMIEARDAYLERETAADSKDMATVRARLQEADYRMRDIAPDVSAAYRRAREMVPEEAAAPVQAQPVEAAAPPRDTAEAPAAETSPRPAPAGEAVPAGAPEPAAPGVPRATEPTPVSAFKTAKGSTYDVHADGTTTRNKAARADVGHEGDFGPKPRTEKTIYVDTPEQAAELSAAGLHGLGSKGARLIIKDGKASLLTWNEKAGQWGRTASATDIPISDQPAVGKAPLEMWTKADDVPGYEAYKKMHAGNEIVEVGSSPAAPAIAAAETRPAAAAPPVNIAQDVTQKLVAAGRPAEEAQAAAEIVKAYWDARAARFKGAKGTAEEMYAREAPDIRAGKERPAKAGAKEFAQAARPGPEAPGVGVEQRNMHGFAPDLRVVVTKPGKLPEKPLFTQETTNRNAAEQIANIDRVLDKFPDVDNPDVWAKMMAHALASKEVPVPPYGFFRDIHGDAVEKLKGLTPGQIADADHGFANGAEFRRAYVNKELPVTTTGKLFLWSFLSRGVSPYVQEVLFIDAFKGIDKWIKKAAEGKFTEADFPEYEAWSRSVAPKGAGHPGAGATHNLNAFGKLFLLKMSERDASGMSHLQRIHDMLSDPEATGQQIRREFMKAGEGVGIDNKVVSFTLLVAGHNDVMVIDRVQTRALFDDGRFAGRNIYDGQKNAEGKVITGTPLANLTYGARGLLVYEAIERELGKRIKQIYTDVGRPDDASVGRYHWETWVAASQQEASHGTLGAILHDAKGDDAAIARVSAKQGEYGAYEYGARYGRGENGEPNFSYATPSGKEYNFSVPAFRAFLDDIKKPATGVVPTKFKVTEAGNAPWYKDPRVNRERLDERAAYWADRGGGTGEGARALREAEQGEISRGAGGERLPAEEVGQGYAQSKRGSISIRDEGRNTITLMKSADASTFIHETGHDWLDRLTKDAADPAAPPDLKADSDTVLKWLGVDKADDIKTKQHEKFARGFETYMMEGRAPSKALASVFAQFKAWLTRIYQTVQKLRAPISDDIRDVFDRLLAEHPERQEPAVIAPDREVPKGFADVHEADAQSTPPQTAHPVAETIQGERDRLADEKAPPEINDARLKDVAPETRRSEPGGAEPDSAGHEAGPAPGRGGVNPPTGEIGAGRAEAPQEGAGLPTAAGGEPGAAAGSEPVAKATAEPGAGRSGERHVKPEKRTEANYSLFEFLASRGGLKRDPELKAIFGGVNPFVPGFGRLLRKSGGMTLDRAREAAVEAGYLIDEGHINGGISTVDINHLLDAIDAESRGTKLYRPGQDRGAGQEGPSRSDTVHRDVREINEALKEVDIDPSTVPPERIARIIEIMDREHVSDPIDAWERAVMEETQRESDRGAVERIDEHIPEWDPNDPETAPSAGHAFAEIPLPEASDLGEGARGAGAGHSGPATEVPTSAGQPFARPTTGAVDKAGNIRLDLLNTPEDINRVIRDAAAENDDFIAWRRGTITDGQVLDLAAAMGTDPGFLDTAKLGQSFNAEQVMWMRKAVIQSATEVRDAMAKAATGTDADVLAYAETKARHQMMQKHLAGATAEAGRALRAFRRLTGQDEAAALGDFLDKENTAKTLYQLRQEAQLGMNLETPAQVSAYVNQLARPAFKDMIIEAWMAFVLSGLKTNVANMIGNTLVSVMRPVETATAAGIGKVRSLVTGSQDRVLAGEAAAELFGTIQGAREGLVAAYKAFQTEEPQFTATKQAEQFHPKAIPSVHVNVMGRDLELGGRQVRVGLRALTAEDELFKGIAFRRDINRQAYATAAREGLEGDARNNRIAELSMNPTDEMVASAKKAAEYMTFQTPLGNVGRAVQTFSNSHLLAKLIVPFVRTPINLLKYAGERTPLGVFSREVRDNLSGKNGAAMRDTQIARIAIGTAIGVTALDFAAQGLITGGGPADNKKRAVMMADGWKPYSVKVGNGYYAYNRLDPFSIILGLSADAYEIHHASHEEHPDKEHIPALLFAAISKNVLERASLKGPSDLIQAVTQPERYGDNYIKQQAGVIVPAFVAQTSQTMDPIVRETRSVLDAIKARTPWSVTLLPRRDVWGEPMMREGGLGPDIASPILMSTIKNDPVNRALLDVDYFPAKLQRKIRGVELTDQQYDDYSRIAGRTAKMRLNMIVGRPGWAQIPKAIRLEMMRKTVTSAHEIAADTILMQNPQIIKKAMDAKREQITGSKR